MESESFLKTYDVTLEVKGPVFIGSGYELLPQEYILMENKLIIPKVKKMLVALQRLGLEEEYEKFVLQETDKKDSKDTKDLWWWLKKQNISEVHIQEWKKYELQMEKSKIKNRPVMEFIKDGYGLPFVPGTSLKGMLRTILLGYSIQKNPNVYADFRVENKYSSDKNIIANLELKAKKLENITFCKLDRKDTAKHDPVNDIMSGLIVSDSEPLSLNDLIICDKYDYSIKTRKLKPIHVYRECLKPGTKIRFTITFDNKKFPYSVEDIEKAIEVFANMSYMNFLKYFEKCPRPKKNTVWLGGGVGFLSKTVIYPLYGRGGVNIAKHIFYKKHKHEKDVKWGISPRCLKMTVYENKEYCFGECLINIKEATGG